MKRVQILAGLLAAVVVLVVAAAVVPWEQYPVFVRVMNHAQNILDRPLLRVGQLPITAAFMLKAVAYLLLLAFVARQSRHLFRAYVLDRMSMTEGHKYSLETTAEYLIIIAGLTVGLESAGLNLSSLALLGGALGIGVGFGLQSIANNFVSGLVLLFEGPVRVGDRIQIAELNGDVVRIGARSTWIRTNDNIIVIVPNSDLIVKPVVNWTATDRQVRFSLPVGVSYGSDPDEVRSVLLAVAARNPHVLAAPAPDVIFTALGDSSLDFELRYWTEDCVRVPRVLKSELYFAIFGAFKERGIEIPYPQQDLHLRTAEASLKVDGGSTAG